MHKTFNPKSQKKWEKYVNEINRKLQSGEIEPDKVTFEEACEALTRTLNINTRFVLKKLNINNYKRNKKVLKNGKGLREFIDLYRDQPGFIVGAGPSLKKNVHELKRIQGEYPIIAVDAVLRALLDEGIDPDYTLTIDTRQHQHKLLTGIKSKTVLLAVSCIHPDVIKNWQGEIRFFNAYSEGKGTKLQLKYGKDFGSIPGGGNVSTMATMFARIFLSCNPIVFVGHDFSYPDFDNYYFGKHHKDLRPHTKKRYTTYDIYTNYGVVTDISLFSYKIWMENQIIHHKQIVPEIEWINATEGGIFGCTEEGGVLIPELKQMKLKDVIDQYEGSDS